MQNPLYSALPFFFLFIDPDQFTCEREFVLVYLQSLANCHSYFESIGTNITFALFKKVDLVAYRNHLSRFLVKFNLCGIKVILVFGSFGFKFVQQFFNKTSGGIKFRFRMDSMELNLFQASLVPIVHLLSAVPLLFQLDYTVFNLFKQ